MLTLPASLLGWKNFSKTNAVAYFRRGDDGDDEWTFWNVVDRTSGRHTKLSGSSSIRDLIKELWWDHLIFTKLLLLCVCHSKQKTVERLSLSVCSFILYVHWSIHTYFCQSHHLILCPCVKPSVCLSSYFYKTLTSLCLSLPTKKR
jgi:hypothetical protein